MWHRRTPQDFFQHGGEFWSQTMQMCYRQNPMKTVEKHSALTFMSQPRSKHGSGLFTSCPFFSCRETVSGAWKLLQQKLSKVWFYRPLVFRHTQYSCFSLHSVSWQMFPDQTCLISWDDTHQAWGMLEKGWDLCARRVWRKYSEAKFKMVDYNLNYLARKLEFRNLTVHNMTIRGQAAFTLQAKGTWSWSF